ncbi:hypothetical protein [Bacillus sp. B1-b2]|uniref:hypothetical protein n=1 Tax=Bacillus sp. B1-b2 TaxID=2653201 RepID=UPI001869A148|nr:hypothetical protein [Bacillus sp. B1-b2]
MNETKYTTELKNGESIIYFTNMPREVIPPNYTLTNQYRFRRYFEERGYTFEIKKLLKK